MDPAAEDDVIAHPADAAAAATPSSSSSAQQPDHDGDDDHDADDADGDGDEQPQEMTEEQQRVYEEYCIWKKNSPYLYDLLVSHALEWPSLTVQWMPEQVVVPVTGGGQSLVALDAQHATQRLVLGTHTAGEDPNYLIIQPVTLPAADATVDARAFADDTDVQFIGTSSSSSSSSSSSATM
jgi:hypothetical protein